MLTLAAFSAAQLYDRLEPYVTESEKSTLMSKLQKTEDWLYEEGEDETKGVYAAKLDELKKVSNRRPQLATILLTFDCRNVLASFGISHRRAVAPAALVALTSALWADG